MFCRRDFLKTTIGCGVLGFAGGVFGASEKKQTPNILWLTIEDTSYYEFGCYGSKTAKTPNVDMLAAKGIRYTNAWSNGPQCSPARSTLITGCYATKYGMDYHRHQFKTPDGIFYPEFLRNAGYYCTNNSKTDYNTKVKHSQMWNECNSKASYNSEKRAESQPFFSVFNSMATHMGRVRSFTLEQRHDFAKDGIFLNRLDMPSHVPDIRETRSDYAFHLEGVQDIDKWVGIFLDDLKAKELDNDTIIFFYSDHGGCLPRGKGFVYDTGLHVPLIVYVPPKWQHLVDFTPGDVSDRLVGFVDLPATVLSLIGESKPRHMQGKAFLGKFAEEPRKYQFGFRCNQEDHYDPARTVTDGKYQYIRSYIPHKPYCLRNFYQWGMPANLGWDEYVLDGGDNENWLQPYKPKEFEMLFEVGQDPYELKNLAFDNAHKAKLVEMRSVLSKHIREIGDLGFFPESTRDKGTDLYGWVRRSGYDLEALHDAAEKASEAKPYYKTNFIEYLNSEYPSIRFWGATGLANFASQNSVSPDACPTDLQSALQDKNKQVAAVAAEACCYFGRYDIGMKYLIDSIVQKDPYAGTSLETISWYDRQREEIMKYKDVLLQNAALQKVRAVLVNLKLMPVSELYLQKDKAKGIAVNVDRRKLVPTP